MTKVTLAFPSVFDLWAFIKETKAKAAGLKIYVNLLSAELSQTDVTLALFHYGAKLASSLEKVMEPD